METTLELEVSKTKVRGLSAHLPLILWRLAFAAAGVVLSILWLGSYVFGKSLDTVPNMDFLWGRVWDMTWEYLNYALWAIIIVVLNARLSIGEIVFAMGVMAAIVLASVLAGALIWRMLKIGASMGKRPFRGDTHTRR